MNVKELRDALNGLPDDSIVVMGEDAEGNGFSPLAFVDAERVYRAVRPWGGEVGFATLTDELERRGYTDEDVVEGGRPCVVLWPTN